MDDNQAVGEITIQNKYGFHVRPSTQFMKTAREYQSDILVEVDNLSADGKSIMQLMALGAMQGAVVKITAKGPDANAAVAALVGLIQSRFGGID
jgi:Phosphotransferase System HPr (HPr) Family